MPEHLSESILTVRNKAEAFAREVLAPFEAELNAGASPNIVRAKVVAASKDAGFFTMTQPKAYSGEETGALALTVVREALASKNLRVTSHVFAPGAGVLGAATGRLKEHYLDPLMRGDMRGSFGFTEPDQAVRPTWATQDGDDIVITGQKSYVTGGADADFVSALVNVEPNGDEQGGTAMVTIDFDAPGVTIDRNFGSLDGSHHVAVRFDQVRVPKWHIVGNIGEGMGRALGDISKVRLSLSAVACGVMQWATEYVGEYIQAPHRSGTPLGKREGVRLRYADMRIETYAARSMLYRTARIVESDANDVNEVMCTKIYCTETAGRVIDMAVQLVGGDALTEGHPLERLYREVRSMRFTEGASDVLRLNIVKGALDLNKGTL
jgi:alkylation response protein AidB-like acyl-CoA dehydrogenase